MSAMHPVQGHSDQKNHLRAQARLCVWNVPPWIRGRNVLKSIRRCKRSRRITVFEERMKELREGEEKAKTYKKETGGE